MKIERYLTLFIASIVLLTSCNSSEKGESKDTESDRVYSLVTVAPLKEELFQHKIRVQGDIITDYDAMISSEMGGQLRSIKVKEGQKVKKGQLLAVVDASILTSNIEELKTQLRHAEYILDKQEKLHQNGLGSEIELESARNQVKALKAKLKSMETQRGKSMIKAPFSGIVDQIFAKQGQMVGPQSPILRLVNNETVDLVASISEKYVGQIKVGTPISVTFPDSRIDTAIVLKITSVGNYINPINRTFRIRTTIKNNDFLLPNMLAEVTITDFEKKGIVIPEKSILKDAKNKDYVFLAMPRGAYYEINKKYITVEKSYQGKSLVQGLETGNHFVVVEGAKGVYEGDKVRVKK